MEEQMSIKEVIDIFRSFLEENWPGDMSPSQYRQAFTDLDDLGMMEFGEINETYSLELYEEDCDFDWNDEEFEFQLSEVISDHVVYLENMAEENDWCEEY